MVIRLSEEGLRENRRHRIDSETACGLSGRYFRGDPRQGTEAHAGSGKGADRSGRNGMGTEHQRPEETAGRRLQRV